MAVGAAVGQSPAAVLSTNLAQAEAVITSDTLVDVDGEAAEEQVIDLIARHAPVAVELRTLVAALRNAGAQGDFGAGLERSFDAPLSNVGVRDWYRRTMECREQPAGSPTFHW